MITSMINPRLKIVMISVADLFLLLCMAGALIGIFVNNMWTLQIKIGTKTDNIKVGLREACFRVDNSTRDGVWKCWSYSEKGFDTDYKEIDVVTYCLVASVASAGTSVLLSIAAIVFRRWRIFKVMVLTMIILAFGAGATCAVTVAYIAGDDSVKKVVPIWITKNRLYLMDKTLDHGWTFYVICTACGCGLLSGILSAILLFIVWDEEEYTANMEELKNELSQSEEVRKNTELNSQLRNAEIQVCQPAKDWTFERSRDGLRNSKVYATVEKIDRRKLPHEVKYDPKQEIMPYQTVESMRQIAQQGRTQNVRRLAEEQEEITRKSGHVSQGRSAMAPDARDLQRIREAHHQSAYASSVPNTPQFFFEDSPRINNRKWVSDDDNYRAPQYHRSPSRSDYTLSYDNRDDSLMRAMIREDMRLSAAYDQYFNEPY